MSRNYTLAEIFRDIFDETFELNCIVHIKMLHHTVFLLKELGVGFYDNQFLLGFYGPYSSKLCYNMQNVLNASFSYTSEQLQTSVNKIRYILRKKSLYSDSYWLETISTLLYLKKYIYPGFLNYQIINKLASMRSNKLDLYDENLNALICVRELFNNAI